MYFAVPEATCRDNLFFKGIVVTPFAFKLIKQRVVRAVNISKQSNLHPKKAATPSNFT